MIQITGTDVYGITHAIKGMRNPMESWELSDSALPGCFSLNDWIGPKDKELMMKLAKAGPEHAKYRRMIVVYCDILAPLYWWKEFDTYKIGTVANSCSTMHKIHAHEFTMDMFSHEHLDEPSLWILDIIITHLNDCRELYLNEDDPDLKKVYWWQMIQLLPSSYNQKRTVMSNYQVLSEQYRQRKAHKLDEWTINFIEWIESLPFNWIITGKDDENIRSDTSWMNDEDIEKTLSSACPGYKAVQKPEDCTRYEVKNGDSVCSWMKTWGNDRINFENKCMTCPMFKPKR